jgi:hypothetical protein
MRWNIVSQIDDSCVSKSLDDSALHYRSKRTFVPKIRGYCDYARGLPFIHGGDDTGKSYC